MKQTAINTKHNKMLQALCCLMMMALAMPVTAKRLITNIDPAKALAREMKSSYKYRKDIPKEVLELTKKWPDKFGVLHSDWIENLNGKSIDLQGNEILSYVNYVNLELCCDTFFVATNAEGKKGVYGKKEQGCIISPIYDEIDFSWTALSGCIIAKHKSKSNDNNDVCTVYTNNGVKLDFMELTPAVGTVYYPKNNLINVIWKDLTGVYQKRLYWTNGKQAMEGELPKGKISLGADGYSYTAEGDTVPTKIPYINTEGEHPKLQVMTKAEMIERDAKDFKNNAWMKLATNFMREKRYEELGFCMDFMSRHEMSVLRCNESEPPFMCYAYGFYAYTMGDKYSTVINRVNGTDTFVKRPSHLLLNSSTGKFSLGKTSHLDANQRKNLEGFADICSEGYSTSVKGQQQKEIRQAQTAAAVLGVLGNTMNTISQGLSSSSSRQSSSTGQSVRTSGGSRSSASSGSSSSSSSSEAASAPTRKTCPRCDGTGTVVVEHQVNGGLQKRMKTCSTCGKTYDSAATGHHHERCNSCRGSGYYEIK